MEMRNINVRFFLVFFFLFACLFFPPHEIVISNTSDSNVERTC